MSDGEIPFGVLLGASAGVAGLAWAGARRRRGGFAIGASLLAVQGALHLLFVRTERPHPAAHLHHHMDMDMGMDMGAATDMGAGGAAMAGMGAHSGIGMVAAHALAGLLCAVWLARGEAALYRLLRVVALLAAAPVRRALALVRAHAPEPPAHRPRPHPHRPRRLRGAVHAHALVRRGPPVFRAPSTTAPGRPACA
ncbi:hypothetical protein [Streptomyces sp. NPDC101132]|uniref:hypothetical protein n=1 Tax=Streptomyces sp. NPDC101132 TaxID=3366110 RepID=UPI0037F3BD33